jgi:EamA-like transporter family
MKWILVLILVGATALGDLLNCTGMKVHGEVHDFRPMEILRMGLRLMRNIRVALGVLVMIGAFIAQMSLLSIAPVSFAVPASSASYVLEIGLAKFLLGESIGRMRWAGAVLVGAGVLLLAR